MNQEIIDFLADKPKKPLNKRKWLQDGFIKIYIKAQYTYVDSQVLSCVNLSTIDVVSTDPDNPELNMGKGLFTKFLDEMEILAPALGYECIKVESVINRRLVQFLLKRGYIQIKDGADIDFGPNLVKVL